MAWSVSVVHRALIARPRRRPKRRELRRRQRSQRWDAYFADPNMVEDDYWRMRRQ